MSEWLEARNILAVRLDNAGDVVMLGPALRAIKETSPRAKVTLLASPGGARASVLLPWVDEVIPWRPVWQDVGNHLPLDPGREMELVQDLKERAFDAALIFTSFSQTPHVPGYVCYLADIPSRAGQSKEFGGSTLTLEIREVRDELHQVDRNLALIESAGFPVRHREIAIEVDSRSDILSSVLNRFGVEPARPYIVIHPGATADARRYSATRFAAAATMLSGRGHQVLVTGTEKERNLLDEVASGSSGCFAACDLTMRDFATVIRGAATVVCNNSLPLHLAEAAGTPVVVLYSGTDLESQWRPRRSAHAILRVETPCHPCYLFECPIGKPCLDVDPQLVVEATEGLMSRVVAGDGQECGRGVRSGTSLHTLSEDKVDPERIVIFRALNLGDMLLAVPALRAIRRRFPKAEITLVGLPWAQQFARRFSNYVDRFVEFPGYPGIAEAEYSPERTEEFLREQIGYRYDLAVQMHGSGRSSNGFVCALGARRSVGHHPADGDALLDISAVYPERLPEVRRNLALARLVDCSDLDPTLEFPLQPEDLAQADRLLAEATWSEGPFVVIHPGARSEDRRWPVERFAEVADSLARHFDARVLLTGTPDEAGVCEDVIRRMENRALDVAGRTDLGGLAATIFCSRLFLGNDSGPSHLAEAVGTPSVRLFGPEEPERWGPLERRDHIVLRKRARDGAWRVDAIEVEEVLGGVGRLVDEPIGSFVRLRSLAEAV